MADPNDRTTSEEIERLFLHEDDALHQRTDWFLVAHAILIEAFLTAATRGAAAWATVGDFALVIAVGWSIIGFRQRRNLEALRRRFQETSTVFAEMHEDRAVRDGQPLDPKDRRVTLTQATPWFALIIPVATVVLWLVLLVSACRGCITK